MCKSMCVCVCAHMLHYAVGLVNICVSYDSAGSPPVRTFAPGFLRRRFCSYPLCSATLCSARVSCWFVTAGSSVFTKQSRPRDGAISGCFIVLNTALLNKCIYLEWHRYQETIEQ